MAVLAPEAHIGRLAIEDVAEGSVASVRRTREHGEVAIDLLGEQHAVAVVRQEGVLAGESGFVVGRLGSEDDVGDLFDQFLEDVVGRDEIGLAVDFDDGGLVAFDLQTGQTFGGDSIGLLRVLGNAFSAIFDSNLTSLITGVILLTTGTGPIRGFATTWIIGIIVSFFNWFIADLI